MELKFREGNISDLKQLREIALASYGEFEKVLTNEDWNDLYSNLNSEASYANLLKIAKCFVCEIDNKIIGVAYLVPSGNPTKIFESDWYYPSLNHQAMP